MGVESYEKKKKAVCPVKVEMSYESVEKGRELYLKWKKKNKKECDLGSHNKYIAALLKKKKKNGMSKLDELIKSVKFSFPGQNRRSYQGGRYVLRVGKDPRLGLAHRRRRQLQSYQKELDEQDRKYGKDLLYKILEKQRQLQGDRPLVIKDVSPHGPPKPVSKELDALEDAYRAERKAALANVSLVDRWEDRLKKTEKEEPSSLKEMDLICALAALASYNDKNGTDYELLETMGSYFGGYYFHCNFRAQLKTASESRCPSSKMFFAELSGIQTLDVHSCVIVNDRNSQIDPGCEVCSGPLVHPVSGYKAGRGLSENKSFLI